jgi:hypothetical protein
MRFEYEELVENFESALLTDLRGHGARGEFLRAWVPDPDPAKSLINMADAASIEGVRSFEIGIAARALPPSAVTELANALAGVYDVQASGEINGRIVVRFFGAVRG